MLKVSSKYKSTKESGGAKIFAKHPTMSKDIGFFSRFDLVFHGMKFKSLSGISYKNGNLTFSFEIPEEKIKICIIPFQFISLQNILI